MCSTIKEVSVIGGVGATWGGRQFKQQFRVIDAKQVSYALNTVGFNGLVVRKWKSKYSDTQEQAAKGAE